MMSDKNICNKVPFLIFLCFLVLESCSIIRSGIRGIELTEYDLEIARYKGIELKDLKRMKTVQLYKFNEEEIDKYLSYFCEVEPNLHKRIQHIARKFLGQPYKIYLLGEFPFEIYDYQPLYSIKKSDCVVFCEHVYAMALSHDWRSFMALLQRIRYKNGEIGLLTRNHYTVYDWDRNNSWLVKDITEKLTEVKAVKDTMIMDKAKFFKKWGVGQDIPVDTLEWSYIPYELLPEVVSKLQTGDFVNIVRGDTSGKWVGHVGLISISNDGTINFIHSTYPEVKEQPIMDLYRDADKCNKQRQEYNKKIEKRNKRIEEYNAKLSRTKSLRLFRKEKQLFSMKPYFLGFKFLRLRENPMEELIKIDGSEAPRVIISPDM
ncbi:MAG: DUF1460 domain-containing protein [Candidatus Marinimicrobia bacterium]|nr:DUF1460 domain-containing protein [Candidatus Neomarinimicrobiota bacterium]